MDLQFMQSDLFNVGSGQDGHYGRARRFYVESKTHEHGQYNNFYSLQHLNYDRDCDAEDLDHSTHQIKVMRGYRHPFDYSYNNVNYTAREQWVNAKNLIGDVYYNPEEISVWTTSWPLLTFFSVWGMNQYLTMGGVWIFEQFGNYNFLFFGFLGKCFMVPWIFFNLFKPQQLGNWTHDLFKQEFDAFTRGLNDAFVDATLEEKQRSLEQMQQIELLDLYPKLRQEFQAELKAKEERQFTQNTNSRISLILDSTLKAETANYNAVNNNVIKRTLHALEESVHGTRVQDGCLQKSMLLLKNIKNKNFVPQKDPLTEVVLETLQAEAREQEKLSEADKTKMFILTEAQKESIKAMDKNLKETQLYKRVEIHEDSIENNKIQQEVLERMK